MAGRVGQRRRLLALVPLAAAFCGLLGGDGPGFLPTARPASRSAGGVARRGAPLDLEDGGLSEMFSEVLYPPEQMWKSNPEGTVLREYYPGARDFTAIFWAITQPAAAAGFLIVGISAYFQEPIVDWNPVTKQLLPFLRNLEGISWVPQGVFMSFYGFFGLFLFGPLQWYLVTTNKGEGVAEFNKKTRRFTIVRDGELLRDMSWDDIDIVRFEWTNLSAFGAREIYLITKENEEVHFMDTIEELPKRVLEKRASQLAEFIGKDLDIDDY